MKTRRRTFTTTVVLAVLMMFANIAIAATPTRVILSNTGGYQGRVSSHIDVCAQVGAACAAEGTVKVKLLKLKDGSWVKVAAKLAQGAAPWQVEFTGAPRRGQCKLVAAYSGSEQWDPSRGSLKGGCNDENWQA